MRKLFLIFIFSLAASACQNENSNSDDAPIVTGTPQFLAANAIMADKCVSCHEHSFHLMTEAQFVTSGRVLGGDPQNSPIYYRLTGSTSPNVSPKNMPTDGNDLTADELNVMITWINSVAP